MNYNVYLLDANDDENTNYFTNEQIKFALIKDNVFVAGTSATEGRKLSSVAGFTAGEHEGEGLVLESQEITAGKTDEYKLRIWISDDVNYSNTDRVDDNTDEFNDAQTSTGKYNSYKYSLKVKVTSEIVSNIVGPLAIKKLNINKLTMTADIESRDGLSVYAVTESETAPPIDSTEWIDITAENVGAKSNVIRTSDSIITSKSIEYMVKKNGTYYLHVKNTNDEVVNKSFTANATGENAVQKIVGLASTNTDELRIDEHEPTGQQTFAATEYRYWGATPNNYVWFNNELWRIIGAMDVDDGTGNIEKRLKIIHANPIGSYSWDSSSENIHYGSGINEWSQADLMTLLNSGAYYNCTTGTCYNGRNNKTTSCDFTTTGLTDEAKEMIGNAKWYLGASPADYASLISPDFYEYERGTNTGKQCTKDNSYCSDSVTRTTSWTGQIGLMYPSDYGYSADMTSCSSTALRYYDTSCKDSTWLYYKKSQWVLNPLYHPTDANLVYSIASEGYLSAVYSDYRSVFPVTYLKSDIKILDGVGTTDRPFILAK